MLDTLERTTMARPKGRPKTSERDDATTRLDRALIGKAKAVATHRGISTGELLSELVRGPLDKAYAAMLRELERGNA